MLEKKNDGFSTLIKTPDEIEKMRVVGRLTAKVLEAVNNIIKPGISTADINSFCEHYITDVLKATPGSIGQYGYPYAVNTSVNKVVCHGVPSPDKVLKQGDIVNVDVTVIKDDYYGDSSKTFCIGVVPPYVKRLVDVTQQCLYAGIRAVRPDATLGDVGYAIQTLAEKNGYSVVREYGGHGIGRQMHEEPHVSHVGKPGTGLRLQPGMTFTIEPMINQGKAAIRSITKNDWTIVVTADRLLSAQWEHTILVTEAGFEIFTLREEEIESWK